jgi:prepilin-type N-terminal cleavage/methylation domain-containing protein
MKRRGFTFIELLVVMIVLGILSTLAILRYIDLKNEALTSKVAKELQAVRLGALNYYIDFGETWPAEVAAGVTPPGLVTYLPRGYDFSSNAYRLDWDNLGGAVAVTVSSTDADLMDRLIRRLGSRPPYVAVGGTLTYVILGPGAQL